ASGDGGGGLCRPLRRGGPLRAGRRAPALEALLADLPARAALRRGGDGGLGGAALAAGLGAAADRGGGRRRQRRRAPGAGVLPGADGPAGGGRLLDVPPAVPVHLPAGGADADRPAAGGGLPAPHGGAGGDPGGVGGAGMGAAVPGGDPAGGGGLAVCRAAGAGVPPLPARRRRPAGAGGRRRTKQKRTEPAARQVRSSLYALRESAP